MRVCCWPCAGCATRRGARRAARPGALPVASPGRSRPRGSCRPDVGHPAFEVADIFRTHGPAWRWSRRAHLSRGQLKVMSAIEQCRSAALGDTFCIAMAATRSRSRTTRCWLWCKSALFRGRGRGFQEGRATPGLLPGHSPLERPLSGAAKDCCRPKRDIGGAGSGARKLTFATPSGGRLLPPPADFGKTDLDAEKQTFAASAPGVGTLSRLPSAQPAGVDRRRSARRFTSS
jgi:hypothetical protein